MPQQFLFVLLSHLITLTNSSNDSSTLIAGSLALVSMYGICNGMVTEDINIHENKLLLKLTICHSLSETETSDYIKQPEQTIPDIVVIDKLSVPSIVFLH